MEEKIPISAFFAFGNAIRGKIVQENPGISPEGIVAKVTDAWKNLTDDEKRNYADVVKQEKAKFLQDKKVYEEEQAKKTAASKSGSATGKTEE